MRSNLISLILLSFCVSATAQPTVMVPFNNVPLARGAFLQAGYLFGTHDMIFCFSDTTQINSAMNWPYRGRLPFSPMPVILKVSSQFEGYFADPYGVITIHNSTNGTLTYSCIFGY